MKAGSRAVGIALVAATVVGCGSSGGLSDKTAKEVLALAVEAANAKGSAHLVSTEGFGSQSLTSVYDVAGPDGMQTISGSTGSSTTVFVDGVAYQKGDEAFLEQAEGFPSSTASALSGRWISFTPGDNGYEQISSGVTLTSALTNATPTGTLKLLRRSMVNGQAVVGVQGGLATATAQSGGNGTQVLYVAEAAPHLPIQLVLHVTQSGQSGSATFTFSRWGESVSETAPPGAIPFSTLTAPSG
jgi:hypothetical protein